VCDLPAFLPRKPSNSAFTSSECVHGTQCGPSFTNSRRAHFINLAERSPAAVMGGCGSHFTPLKTDKEVS
jgi:hypothetical protein